MSNEWNDKFEEAGRKFGEAVAPFLPVPGVDEMNEAKLPEFGNVTAWTREDLIFCDLQGVPHKLSAQISLRDRFAMIALDRYVEVQIKMDMEDRPTSKAAWCEFCYEWADAMMKAREGKE